MQHTRYYVMKEVGPAHWIEQRPFPRSKRMALSIAREAASDGKQVKVERITTAHTTIITFNKSPK